MRKLFLLLSLVLTLAGCSQPAPQEAVSGGSGNYFSYQIPGSWEKKNGEWYEGRKLRLRIFDGRDDTRLRKVEEFDSVLNSLARSDFSSATEALYRIHPIRAGMTVPPDLAELDTAWKKVEQVRPRVSRLSKEKASAEDIAAVRAQLEKIRQEHAAIAGDITTCAARLGTSVTGYSYDFSKATSKLLKVDGQPAVFLAAPHRNKSDEHIGYLVYKVDKTKFVSLALFSETPVELARGEELANSIRLNAQPPVREKLVKDETNSPRAPLPREIWVALIVMGIASFPAALGAAWGYRAPTIPYNERAASAGAGAFFFTAVSMGLGICGLTILSLSSLNSAKLPHSGTGLMVGVALLIFLAFYGSIAAATWFATCSLARIGAKLGAPMGILTSSLGASILATIGCLFIPFLLGWFR